MYKIQNILSEFLPTGHHQTSRIKIPGENSLNIFLIFWICIWNFVIYIWNLYLEILHTGHHQTSRIKILGENSLNIFGIFLICIWNFGIYIWKFCPQGIIIYTSRIKIPGENWLNIFWILYILYRGKGHQTVCIYLRDMFLARALNNVFSHR